MSEPLSNPGRLLGVQKQKFSRAVPGGLLNVRDRPATFLIPPAWPVVGTLPRTPEVAYFTVTKKNATPGLAYSYTVIHSTETVFYRPDSTTRDFHWLYIGSAAQVAEYIAQRPLDATYYGNNDYHWVHEEIGTFGQVATNTPTPDLGARLRDTAAIIKAARPGRTFVVVNELPSNIDAGLPSSAQIRDTPNLLDADGTKTLFPNLLLTNVGKPSLFELGFYSTTLPFLDRFPRLAIRSYVDGRKGTFGLFADAGIAAWVPPADLRWDNSSMYAITNDPAADLQTIARSYSYADLDLQELTYQTRQGRMAARGVDYQYRGRLETLDAREIANEIAAHFGFSL